MIPVHFKYSSRRLFALCFGAMALLAGCDQSAPQNSAAKQPVPVTVFEVPDVNYTLKAMLPGRTLASEVAEIRPQVSGIILNQEFKEGGTVSQGESLYQIDPTLYQAEYESALANVESAQANANNTQSTLERYQALIKKRSVSQQDYDLVVAENKQAQAALNVAKAALKTAEVNLNYTKVRSPISGYIGISSVTEGALVSANQSTALATVRKLDPIYVDMTQAATIYEQNQREANQLYTPINKVNLYFNDGTAYREQGDVKFLDKAVSETTGTVTIRSQFNNPDNQILPGMFVKPELVIGRIDQAILVPQSALSLTPALTYSAVVAVPQTSDDPNAETTYVLEQRNHISVYKEIPGYWIVTDGIAPGEWVVTKGLINLQGKDLNSDAVRQSLNVIIAGHSTLTQEDVDKL